MAKFLQKNVPEKMASVSFKVPKNVKDELDELVSQARELGFVVRLSDHYRTTIDEVIKGLKKEIASELKNNV
jgi:hypothetical protein